MAEHTYRDAGVDIAACDAWLARLGQSLPAIGGFAGLMPLGPLTEGMREPCLVASCDGVGTKVLVARSLGDLSTIGIDCVAMVVNDLICCGAEPVIFLDYLAVGKFDAAEADQILAGLRRGCEEADCALIGGETAELPGLLRPGDFDVCGFGLGLVDRPAVIDGSRVAPGDRVVGLPSTGLHSNGFSLARRVLGEDRDERVSREMLTPTAICVRTLREIRRRVDVKAVAHITGGGLPGNLRRALPAGVDAVLDPARWPRPAIFDRLESLGVEAGEMYRTFNMGIGMALVVDSRSAESIPEARVIGEITEGSGQVHIEGVRT
ncbi:phosphoribosylformylglycinamidine cyclo-ligase [Candidatus Sumerlaeota bacterium]|nr:phosphoribosylformylglycinamidine cyclo-ligase [Candidatus Sumerlaeota bacterium]